MSPRRGSSRWDKRTRERALELAEKRGLGVASRELGIPYGTIKWWRHRAEVRAGADRVGPRKGRTAD
jgi:transposase-like protein